MHWHYLCWLVILADEYKKAWLDNCKELVDEENAQAAFDKLSSMVSGEFTYFCIAPDTSATTYHIEQCYGSDLEKLGQYDAGEYAYWLGSGISTDCDQTMIENCIKLFCEENLS